MTREEIQALLVSDDFPLFTTISDIEGVLETLSLNDTQLRALHDLMESCLASFERAYHSLDPSAVPLVIMILNHLLNDLDQDFSLIYIKVILVFKDNCSVVEINSFKNTLLLFIIAN